MFGYVTPCKSELKIKDYEKFRAYYCGLCKAIKNNYGNLPRAVLNYDMTFLGVLLDSFNDKKFYVVQEHCIVHPVKKKAIIINNKALDYAAFCNVALAYYKLLDNVTDDNSKLSKIYSLFLNQYIKKAPMDLKIEVNYIEEKLKKLSVLESNSQGKNIDEISHPFADLTGFIISSYFKEGEDYKTPLYWLGYNLGKWIYIIDAYDDLEKDMENNKFNAINSLFNINNLNFKEFKEYIESRINFILVTCASQCFDSLNDLPLKRNTALLDNILQFGLMEKMDRVFGRRECSNEESL